MDVIQTTTHFLQERAEHEIVLKRLRTTRELHKPKTADQAKKLFWKLRGIANSLRIDWIKSRLRWMADQDAMNKLKANFAVEKQLGRQEPELWTEQSDFHRSTRLDLARSDEDKPRVVQKYNKESMELWRHQIDPMLAEEKAAYGNPPAAKDIKETQEIKLVRVESDRRQRTRLRMLEQRRSSEDLVLVAENLVEQIALATRVEGEETQNFSPENQGAAHENLPAVVEQTAVDQAV